MATTTRKQPVMPTTNRPRNAGTSLNDDASRLDGVMKVTGKAKYGRDVYLPNSLFVRFIRCPFGAGELTASDVEAAQAVPGVVEVSLSGTSGKHHGATVGYVVAESPLAAKRALAALKPQWKLGEIKTRFSELVGEGEGPGKDAIDGADGVLEAVYSTEVQTHACLETHGASVDHRGESATIYSSTQGTFAARDGLDSAIGLDRSNYEVVCEFVGGGFGSKLGGAGKEGVTAAKVAAKYKRPTYLFVDRREEHLDTGNRPSYRAAVRIGYKKDGTIVGGAVRTWGIVGIAGGGGGAAFPSGRYDLPELDGKHKDLKANAGGPRPMRAPGHPQGSFVEEIMLEEVATACGIDSIEFRKKIDRNKERHEMMDLGAGLIGWEHRKPTGSQTGPVRRGFGVAVTSWHRSPARADAEVVINRDGSVEARTGTQDIGTGTRTALGVAAAYGLGVPLDLVSCRIGRSTLPAGPGSGGSVTAPNVGNAMLAAAADAKANLLKLVANLSAADAADFELKDNAIFRGGNKVMTWAEACSRIGPDGIIGRGSSGRDRQGKGATPSTNGVQLVDLEVDTETGVITVNHVVAIQACGRALCRKTAESQILGSVIQGLSFALFEQRVLDRNVGSMLNANLEQYKILGPRDMPHIEPIIWKQDTQQFGPIGEPPVVPTAGAVACAVLNALGKPVRSLPMTPDRVLAALEQGGRA